MKILLMRHGKSDWHAGASSDRTRPLNPRGLQAARAMGASLTAAGILPDVVLSSPATRALDTARQAVEAGSWTVKPTIVDAFYGGGVNDVLSAIRSIAPSTRTVVAVGHEPTWSSTVTALCGARVRMVTAAIACIDVPSVEAASPGRGEMRWMLAPRLFTDGHIGVVD